MSLERQIFQTGGRLDLGRKEATTLIQLLLVKRPRQVGRTGCKVYIQEYNVYLKYLQCWLKQYFYNFFRSTTIILQVSYNGFICNNKKKCFKQSLKNSGQLQNVSVVPFIGRNRAMMVNVLFMNGSTLPGNAMCAAVKFTRV